MEEICTFVSDEERHTSMTSMTQECAAAPDMSTAL